MDEQVLLKLVFALPILLVGGASALHATGYLHGDEKRRQGWFWCYFLGTLVSMGFVIAVRSPLAFLLSWEAMGLFSAGLVGFDSSSRESRRATWIYLLACQAGAFMLMLSGVCIAAAYSVFLAFIGFALKIGFPPFHVWLPEAHPAAPAPASAVMSGAMIPLGFYGLLSFVRLQSATAAEYSCLGWVLLGFGIAAALGGILLALPQRNLKKLLACSSVENMGVIALGLSLAMLVPHQGSGEWVYRLAAIGALAHVVNHALLKGALFLGAGSVLRMTGTLDMDRLGGLMKRMPWTGTLFTVNAIGLSGLPPLNGFIGEALIYVAALLAISKGLVVVPAILVVVTLALTGGIAAAVYTKAVSAVFLGAERSELSGVVETPRRMLIAIGLLTVLSLLLSGAIIFALPIALLAWLRSHLSRGRVHPRQLTWDCGYAQPTARMAWTGTAFSQPLADIFKGLLCPRLHVRERFEGLLPRDSAIAIETDDPGLSRFFQPIFHQFARIFQRIHLLQNGSLHFYVLLMILAVIALLVWGALA